MRLAALRSDMPSVQTFDKSQIAPPQPGSFRHNVLQACKRYKAAWAELGKLLLAVRDQALHEQWGYPDFYTYCQTELSIRRQTADKLTRNFAFLDKHEPERMKDPDYAQTAPPFEVVEVLAQAEARGELSADEYKSVRDSIWSQEKPLSEMRREIAERFPAPEAAPLEGKFAIRRLLSMARKLSGEMAATSECPKAITERADALVGDLEDLLKTAKAKA